MHSTKYSNMTDSEILNEASHSNDELVSALLLIVEKYELCIERLKITLDASLWMNIKEKLNG